MEKRNLAAAVIAAFSLVSGCAYTPVPLEEYHALSNQLDMQAAHHWNILAEKVATTIYENLPKQPEPADLSSVFQEALPAGTMPAPDIINSVEPIAVELDRTPVATPVIIEAEVPVLSVEPIAINDNTVVAIEPISTTPQVVELDLPPGTKRLKSMSARPIMATPIVRLPPPAIVQHPAAIIAPPPVLSANPITAFSVGQEDIAPLPPSLYINPPRGGQESPFMLAFHDLLRSHLVQKGIVVSTRPDAVNTYCSDIATCKPMILDYTVQVVQHKDRMRYTQYAQSNTEVLIHTKITDGDLIVFSRSDLYYINRGDADHYQRRIKTMRVTDR